MLNLRMLRAAIAAAGYTQRKLAKEIGMSGSTFARRIKSGNFGTDEAMRIVRTLNIQDPAKIFFAD